MSKFYSLNAFQRSKSKAPSMTADKTQSWFFRPKLWAVTFGCGVIVFCLVRSCSVVVVVGLLVWFAMALGAVVVAAAAIVTWITVVVLLAFIGRSRRRLVAVSKEIMVGFVVNVLWKEVNVFAVLFWVGLLGVWLGVH